jgi:hypothetical protein
MEQHNNNFMRPTNDGYHILQKVKEYYSSRVVSLVASQVHRLISHIRWKPPEDGRIKLNTDGACKERIVISCVWWAASQQSWRVDQRLF